MKKTIRIFKFIAILSVICLSLLACDNNNDDDNGGFDLPANLQNTCWLGEINANDYLDFGEKTVTTSSIIFNVLSATNNGKIVLADNAGSTFTLCESYNISEDGNALTINGGSMKYDTLYNKAIK